MAVGCGYVLLHFFLFTSAVIGARIDSKKAHELKQNLAREAASEEAQSLSWSAMGGVRNRRAAQQARQVSEEVGHMPTGTSIEDTQQAVQRDVGNGVVVTPNMISTARETNENIAYNSQTLGTNGHVGWANPETIINTAGLPTPTRMRTSYPGQNANERERHEFMQHLDALMSEATFMEHEETREDWEKHAILCDQGFQLQQKGSDREILPHERELNEDFVQTYEGDENLRSGYSDGKIELIIRHPSLVHNKAGAPPQMYEYKCTNCLAEGQRGSSKDDEMIFEPVVSPGVTVQDSGVAVLSAPGLFSYSFNFDTRKGTVEKSDIGFRGREYMTVTMADSVISRIVVAGKKWQASNQKEAVLSAEEHQFHCDAATKNRHTKKITILSPASSLPAFPNFLGSFDVTGLEHEEGDEKVKGDADFIKVTMQACGPCNHRISTWNDNVYGLQEVNTGGEPCGNSRKKTDDGCPSVHSKSHYGVWYFTTKKFDSEVLPLLEQLETEMEIARSNDLDGNGVPSGLEVNHTAKPNEVSGDTIFWDLQELVARIKDQEMKFPWNQKMEAMGMKVEECGIQDVEESSMWGKKMVKKAVCPKQSTPSEVRYLHDGSLMHDSGEDVTFEFLKTTTDSRAPTPTQMKQGYFGNNALQGMSFNLLNTVMKGGMNWHVSVPRYGACVPVMEEYFYVGVGADTTCDLDLGIVLWSNAGGHLSVLDYMNYNRAHRLGKAKIILGNALQYSGDNRNAAGEGDDEWMMLKLDEIKNMRFKDGKRANYITIHVNIFEGASNFGDLEGAFARYVAGDPNAPTMVKKADGQNAFQVAPTINYLDLDACPTISKYRSTILAMLFLENDREVLLPEDVMQDVKDVSGTIHYELVTLGQPSSARAAHNSTSQGELLDFWKNIHKLGKEEKIASNNAVTNVELGGEDVRTEVLQNLPGGVDPMTNMIEAQHISSDSHLKEKDKEVDRQSKMMGGGDKIVLESANGYCFHMDMSGAVVMRHGCGVGGDAIRFEYTKQDTPMNFILRDANFRCLQPTGTNSKAALMMVDACEDVWEMKERHGNHFWVHKASNLCAGYDAAPPTKDTPLLLVDCSEHALVAELSEHMLIPGLFDNLLYEFPAGPPGTDALCFAPAKK